MNKNQKQTIWTLLAGVAAGSLLTYWMTKKNPRTGNSNASDTLDKLKDQIAKILNNKSK